MIKKIPLSGGVSNATYSQYITLGDFSVQLQLYYQQNGQWAMNVIADGDAGDVPTTTVDDVDYIAMGVMLEGGDDILCSYGISKTFGQMFLSGDEATLDNLGSSNSLLWFSFDSTVSYS